MVCSVFCWNFLHLETRSEAEGVRKWQEVVIHRGSVDRTESELAGVVKVWIAF